MLALKLHCSFLSGSPPSDDSRGLIRRRQVGPGDFDHTPGGGVYLNDGGRTRLIEAWEAHKETEIRHQLLGRPVERWALPSVQATLLARHLRGDLPAYPPFVLP